MADTILSEPQPPSWQGVCYAHQLASILDRHDVEGRTYSSACLNKELAHGRAVVHGVEARDLIDAHGRHLEQAGDLIHDADGGEAVLALAEVEKRHDRGLLVLRRVALQDLGDELLVLRGELEGDAGVVVGSVAVLVGASVSEVYWSRIVQLTA